MKNRSYWDPRRVKMWHAQPAKDKPTPLKPRSDMSAAELENWRNWHKRLRRLIADEHRAINAGIAQNKLTKKQLLAEKKAVKKRGEKWGPQSRCW